MINTKFIYRILFVFFLLNLSCETGFFSFRGVITLHASEMDFLRTLYYKSVDDENALDKALEYIEFLRHDETISEALLMVYEGSLTGLKGKHAFSPRKKYAYVMESLPVMEKARKMDSLNVEILFIQGTTTYYLPFFFHQADRAAENFHTIIRLLPDVYEHYPEEVVFNVIGFLEENNLVCLNEGDCEDDLLRKIRTEYAK